MRTTRVLAVALATLTISACGAPGEEDRAEDATGTRQDALLAFAECMREHGVNMPDPQFDQDGSLRMGVEGGAFDPSDPAFEEAEAACEEHLAGVTAPSQGGDPAALEERRKQLAAFAECMRGEGIDFRDPEVRGGAVSLQMKPGDYSEADVKRAEEVCRDELPEEERQQMTGGGVH